MKPFLAGKTAGLPRWVWLALLGGGVGLGLYLRNRSTGEPVTEEEVEEGPEIPESLSEEYAGTETAGGLQALGVPGPVSGGVTPIQTPYVPEGFTEVIGGQGETITSLANGVLESQTATSAVAQTLAEREPGREIIRERIGSQATRKPHKLPPKKAKPKPRPKKPTKAKNKKKAKR